MNIVTEEIASSMASGSWIRKMFEKGRELKDKYGEDAVCDFSLGNPDVPPPAAAKTALEKIAETFYISKTHLNRLFKTSVGTTVGKYIKLKRLFFAKELIQKGERPMDIYAKCGFNDYTTFYRSFKKYFLVSPKETSV